MEFSKEMYYIGNRSFKSKEGKQFHIVTLAEYDEKSGLTGANEMFVDEIPKLCEKLHFLDKVECSLTLESMSGKPDIPKQLATASFTPVAEIKRV